MISVGDVSDRALRLAIERGTLTQEQVAALGAIERELGTQEPVDSEKLRFITGFADIFVTIGIVLFLGALAYIMDQGTGSTPMYAGIAVCAWLLAEFFTAKRRMALPSIVLLLAFVVAVFVLSLQIATAILQPTAQLSPRFWFMPVGETGPIALAAIVAIGMAAMHYFRFRVPITIAAGTAALCVLALAIVANLLRNPSINVIDLVLLVCGLAVFALAMRFDMSDPERETRRTDIAFWLHLLAAPLIVHPLVEGLLGGLDPKLTTGGALGILWLFLALGIVAVIIDRRAILVSGLVYAGIAFGSLIRQLGFHNESLQVPVVVLALGAFILLLSAGWQPLRRAFLKRLPARLAERLPHPLVASNA